MTATSPADRHRFLRLAGALAGLAVALGACKHTEDVTGSVADFPADYRQRHPIAIQEADRSIVVFVGHARGLTAPQRTDINGLARTWLAEGTGAITVDVPTDTPNARAAAEAFREIHATLVASGVPPRGIIMRHYRPDDVRTLATIRLSYAKIGAVAGPCGLWPEDIGPSIKNKSYFENKQYYNFGCAYQRNMAAMIDNPSDLVQPRPETPPYTARRTQNFEKYRKGTTSATSYPEADKAKLSDTGK